MSIAGVKETISDYALFYDDITCLSSLNVSGNIQLKHYTTINVPLYKYLSVNTHHISLSVNCTSISNLVNIVQNATWNASFKNYALNVTGYSNFGRPESAMHPARSESAGHDPSQSHPGPDQSMFVSDPSHDPSHSTRSESAVISVPPVCPSHCGLRSTTSLPQGGQRLQSHR
jgi:hypothetical protein